MHLYRLMDLSVFTPECSPMVTVIVWYASGLWHTGQALCTISEFSSPPPL